MLKDDEAKRILGRPEFMRDFIHRYAPFAWATRVGVGDLELVTGEHHVRSVSDGKPSERRYSDLIFRVRNPERPGETGAYVLVLVEAQSRPDARMPLRMLEYVVLTLNREWRPEQRIPAVLPVVFYTGSQRWDVARRLGPLREAVPAGHAGYQPEMAYLLVSLDEGSVERAEAGRLMELLVATLQVPRQGDVTRPLAELMMEGKRSGEVAALDWIAPALANALYRRHRPATPARMIASMEGLMEEASEWIIPPGACELEEELARVKALRERDLEERERERVELARVQALRERDLEERERERGVLIRLLGRLAPDLDGERLAELSSEELVALAEELS